MKKKVVTCVYDELHAEKRRALVPIAQATADAKCPKPTDKTSVRDMRLWSLKWDATFHREMERLVSDPFALGSA